MQLFSDRGFDNVTVDEIVLKANASKGAFYNHFNSKDEIFIEKFKEIDHFYVEFLNSLPEGLSNQEKIIKLIEAQMIYIKDELGKDIMRTIYMNAISTKPEPDRTLAKRDRPLYQMIESLFEQGQKAGEFKLDLKKEEISMLITRCMRGSIYDWCLFEEDLDLVQEAIKTTLFILEGIKR